MALTQQKAIKNPLSRIRQSKANTITKRGSNVAMAHPAAISQRAAGFRSPPYAQHYNHRYKIRDAWK